MGCGHKAHLAQRRLTIFFTIQTWKVSYSTNITEWLIWFSGKMSFEHDSNYKLYECLYMGTTPFGPFPIFFCILAFVYRDEEIRCLQKKIVCKFQPTILFIFLGTGENKDSQESRIRKRARVGRIFK